MISWVLVMTLAGSPFEVQEIYSDIGDCIEAKQERLHNERRIESMLTEEPDTKWDWQCVPMRTQPTCK